MTFDRPAPGKELPSPIDLLVIGGGINGTGIARDAAGRGLSVVLAEQGDLAGATSSASSKLIHGGLRYLEHYEFRLVAEALAERETLLAIAPHLVWPMRFVMPHAPGLRPRWMIRAGLFLYDRLGRRQRLPGSGPARLDQPPFGNGLHPGLRHGFIYSDCRTDDARLVIANALDASRRGARILPRTRVVSAIRDSGEWCLTLDNGRPMQLKARAIVNAAGPWVKDILDRAFGIPTPETVRLVRGSHLVMPRLYQGEHALILQNDDRRVVFLIPYEENFTLLGTTDVAHNGDAMSPLATDAEARYLCRATARYLTRPPTPDEAVWRYAGVRPLLDDGAVDPAAVTRDYLLRLDTIADGSPAAPVLSVFGGKLTTYRRLAEQAVSRLAPLLGNRAPEWTHAAPLPGGDIGPSGFLDYCERELIPAYPWLPAKLLSRLARRHGSEVHELLRHTRKLADLGEQFGGGLTELEVEWFREREWALTADDVLWRRSKCGLHMTAVERARFATLYTD